MDGGLDGSRGSSDLSGARQRAQNVCPGRRLSRTDCCTHSNEQNVLTSGIQPGVREDILGGT
jgi:hypothetical protein